MKDSGAFLERKVAGLQSVSFQDKQQTEYYTNYSWGYQVINCLPLEDAYIFHHSS